MDDTVDCQQKRILDAIRHCDEIIIDKNICDGCRDDHKNLKEWLQLVYDILPVIELISVEELRKIYL